MTTARTSWPAPAWQPPKEALETVAKVVASRWNAAKTSERERPFWSSAPRSWLGAYLPNWESGSR